MFLYLIVHKTQFNQYFYLLNEEHVNKVMKEEITHESEHLNEVITEEVIEITVLESLKAFIMLTK